jgi:type VI secretion system secreted protein Hcp
MSLNSYLSITGKKQGLIKGSVTQRGREGKIIVNSATHELGWPVESRTGLMTGQRVHKPFVITKELDASSPGLYTALVNLEVLTAWELQFWGASATGAEALRYTVRLTNPIISDIRFHMPNDKDPDLARLSEYEEVAFVYERIEWLWVQGGLKAGDQWADTRVSTRATRKPAARPAVPSTRSKK